MKLKYSLRAFVAYEEATGDIYSPSLKNNLILFYCFLSTSDKEYTKTFDEFISDCDENPKMVEEFLVWLGKEFERINQFSKDDSAEKKK